jgi:hypothetical protein
MASDGLRIFTNRGPAEVTRILEVEPTEIRKARRADGPPEHRWVWLWKTELEDTEPFDAHAAAFIAQFRSRAERLRQLTTDSVVGNYARGMRRHSAKVGSPWSQI